MTADRPTCDRCGHTAGDSATRRLRMAGETVLPEEEIQHLIAMGADTRVTTYTAGTLSVRLCGACSLGLFGAEPIDCAGIRRAYANVATERAQLAANRMAGEYADLSRRMADLSRDMTEHLEALTDALGKIGELTGELTAPDVEE